MICVIHICISVLNQHCWSSSWRLGPHTEGGITLTTAEGWNDRFDPLFLLKVFLICITRPQKFLGGDSMCFTPSETVFFLHPWVQPEFCKKIGSKRPSQPSAVVRTIYTPLYGVPAANYYVDDQHRNTNMKNKDHLVGQLTRNPADPHICEFSPQNSFFLKDGFP